MIDSQVLRAVLGPSCPGADEIESLKAALLAAPPTSIRCTALDPEYEPPFAVDPVDWHPHGRIVRSDARPSRFLDYIAGDYFIQDAGSLLALRLIDARPGERVGDLCASPGGKATALARQVGPQGWLLANEPVRSRLPALKYNLARYAPPCYVVAQRDPQVLAEQLGASFDRLLVDAPCSGQALVGRGKQSLAAFDSQAISHCAARQTRILNEAARLLKPGGQLVYATCTLAFEENEAQIERFLDAHPGWRVRADEALARWESPALPGSYRLWPHRDRCGGAFAVALVRETVADETVACETSTASEATRSRSATTGRLQPGTLPSEFATWGTLLEADVMSDGERLFAWPQPLWDALLPLAVSGPEIAYLKGKTWFPSHSLALRADPAWTPRCSVNLAADDAESYWQGNVVPCDRSGWSVACWESRPLGWLKSDGRRGKNHLPKSARRLH